MTLELSPSDALAMFESMESGKDVPLPGEAEPPAPSDIPASAAQQVVVQAQDKAAETQQQTPAQTEAEAQGIATRDGQHIIPYAVLALTRQRASQAEERARALEAEVAELRNKTSRTNEAAPAKQSDPAITPDPLDELAEDFPILTEEAKKQRVVVSKLQQELHQTQEKLNQIQQATQQRTEAEQRLIVQTAIDSVPKLAFIQENDEAKFKLAQQFDQSLMNQPEWAERPLAERYKKVMELVEAASGVVVLPGQTSSKDASAVIEQAKAKPTVPTSLSNLPPGAAVAHDELAAIESLGALGLQQKMASMSLDQIDAFLANI